MGNILVLGAGMVSRPLIYYLAQDCGQDIQVASRTLEKARKVIGAIPDATARAFDIGKDDDLPEMLQGIDVVVSLLPYIHHVKVAKAAIGAGAHLVTTSYVSPAMKALDADARDAGVTLLNEIGLDPGIDHMEAMRIIDGVHGRGGSVIDFISYCGGLPAPEANDNPWGYKFSWSPKGVVLASRNNARFRKEGKEVVIPGKDLFANYERIEVEGLDTFEGYPNRDSVPYADIYGIPGARTVLRGTLRNNGWCDTWKALHDIGAISDGPTNADTWKGLIEGLLPGKGDLMERIRDRISTKDDDRAISNMEWLGLLSDSPIDPEADRVDSLSNLLESRLAYGPGERDMIVLMHLFRINMDGREETIRSTMVDFGVPGGDSAMSRTVGIPAAIGTDMLLNEELPRGVLIPTIPRIYGPALKRLAEKGISFVHG